MMTINGNSPQMRENNLPDKTAQPTHRRTDSAEPLALIFPAGGTSLCDL